MLSDDESMFRTEEPIQRTTTTTTTTTSPRPVTFTYSSTTPLARYYNNLNWHSKPNRKKTKNIYIQIVVSYHLS